MRLAILSVLALASTARAELHRAEPVPTSPSVLRAATVPKVLYLDRCASGCTLGSTGNDATTDSSTIPMGTGPFKLTAFGFGDTEWAQVVTCVREVFSPYDLAVVDTKPAAGTLYNKTFVAGLPTEIGQSNDVLGIAPLATNCSVLSNTVAFAFANQHTPTDRVHNICWTVAQESAHMYGLDHEYEFDDKSSACNDPMTYRTDCGGQKFFRDKPASCGEFAARTCKCDRASQDSDGLLFTIFGGGTPTTSAPEVTILVPPAGGMTVTKSFVVQAMAGSQRGVAHVQLVLNGHVWLDVPGTGYGAQGQPSIAYGLGLPAAVPDGVIDVQVRAIDDIGIATTSAPVTVTKGAACTDATTCAANQTCTAGKCTWPAPTLAAGEACDFNEACASNACVGGACEATCDADSVRNACEVGFACTNSLCVATDDGGGCCSSGPGSSGAPTALVGMFGLALLLRRRSR